MVRGSGRSGGRARRGATLIPAVVLPFALAVALTAGLRAVLARRGVVDVPNARSLHDAPVPRGAGAAVLGAVVVAVLVSGVEPRLGTLGLLAVPVLLGVLGLADDLRSLPALARLALQAGIAAAVLVVPSLGGAAGDVAVGLVGALAVLVFVNVYNFMDGINGLAAGQAVVAGAVWLAAGALADEPEMVTLGAITAAASAGFLPFNFPTARVFMGDAGSYSVGGWLAVVAVEGVRRGMPPDPFLAVLGLFLFDSAYTIVQRLRRGENVLRPHRSHVYQRLVQAGWSHARTTTVCCALMLALGLLGLVVLVAPPVARLAACAGAVVVLAGYARLPRVVSVSAG